MYLFAYWLASSWKCFVNIHFPKTNVAHYLLNKLLNEKKNEYDAQMCFVTKDD
jgi:hypothetical protein